MDKNMKITQVIMTPTDDVVGEIEIEFETGASQDTQWLTLEKVIRMALKLDVEDTEKLSLITEALYTFTGRE